MKFELTHEQKNDEKMVAVKTAEVVAQLVPKYSDCYHDYVDRLKMIAGNEMQQMPTGIVMGMVLPQCLDELGDGRNALALDHDIFLSLACLFC